MAARVESCRSWFLAARLVANTPGGRRGVKGREEEVRGKEEKRKKMFIPRFKL